MPNQCERAPAQSRTEPYRRRTRRWCRPRCPTTIARQWEGSKRRGIAVRIGVRAECETARVRSTTAGMRALILDVDGVVSPVGDSETLWGDEVVGGDVFGPVRISPTLCARLEELSRTPGVSCWWLTSWSVEMRAGMHTFPGRDWPVVAEPSVATGPEQGWWKLAAVEIWLERHPELSAFAWCDDHLRGGRPAAIRRRLSPRGVETLLLAPRTEVGLTPRHVDALEAWATS